MTTTVEPHRGGWVADDSTFGARLALIRQRMSWGNLKEAAEECGLPVESWRRWERDGRAPRDIVQVASAIADRTGCDYGWLLAGPRLASRSDTIPRYRARRQPINVRPPVRLDHDRRPPGRPRLTLALVPLAA